MVVDLVVNGRRHRRTVPARTSLADLLRDRLGLTGTHLGCEHGVCGACSVLVDGQSVRSCLLLAAQASGHEVRTVEDLADGDVLSPLQQALAERHGLQCGFCTPGVLMVATELLRQPGPVDEQTVRDWMSGNVCRCTGYQGIVDAILDVAAARSPIDDEKT
ncbi:MAG: 2Fe-2S iron-sulfur cluster binding domain-containing protein [Streptosporangiales bacterium]|nr:2Fe-2S iron-sulfur cluster binding domain-containing protein [Streptosporangiales bacterium]